jgi:hypothetical protein
MLPFAVYTGREINLFPGETGTGHTSEGPEEACTDDTEVMEVRGTDF